MVFPGHSFRRCLAAAGLLTGVELSAAAGMPRGLRDHSLCCGLRPGSINGDGFFEPGADPLLDRHRLPPPGTVADAPPAPVIPGSDGFATEIPGGFAAPADQAAPAARLEIPTEKVDGHLKLGFNVLGGYPFQLTKEDAKAAAATPDAAAVLAQIPDAIRELDGQKVLVSGFMLPMKMEGLETTEFLLVANSMLCCYGVVPPMNQWMVVRMKKGGVKPQQDVPLSFFGTLRVQPRFDGDALSAIYHLEGDRPYTGK